MDDDTDSHILQISGKLAAVKSQNRGAGLLTKKFHFTQPFWLN